MGGGSIIHKASNDIYLPTDLINGSITLNDGTIYTIVDKDSPESGEINVGTDANGFTILGSSGNFYSGNGTIGGFSLNGTYFTKFDGRYISSLVFAE